MNMNRYINRTKHNLLVFYESRVCEVRPGEIIKTKEVLNLECLEFLAPKKRAKKSPKKEDVLDVSSTT